MKKSFISLCAMSILVSLLAADPIMAASKKKTPVAPKAPTIASVTPTALTVSEEKATKTYGITQFTEIMVNGQKATVAELKPGMTVNVTLGTDPTKASRIHASGAGK